MTFKNTTVLFTLFTMLFCSVATAQTELKSEEDLKKQASELFESKMFVQAAPLYAQLLSLYPKEPDYNFKYGACLLYSESDKSKSLKYLAFATSKPSVDNKAYYYAGRAYHLNYQFTKALKNYNRFKAKATSLERKEYEIDQQIEMVKNGNELLRSINRLDVISKESVSKDDFFRIYELNGLNGKLVVKPDEFKSKYDKKNDENSIMFLPDNTNEVYFSSYGKNGDNGRDIYKAVKLGNGKWSEAVSIGNSINTPFDEAFAFILPDGRTMYFASKGHNSIGGYDLFKSTFDESTANWTKPVNLDFPFSTVNDDVMFVSNTDQTLAYFASDRNNVDNQYNVYKVGTTPKKPDLFVIKGKFIAESIPNLKRAKITVVDAATNETVGIYDTDENGNYTIEVERAGGSYKFNIETTEDAPIHAGVVNVPKQNDFVVLGQELRLVGEAAAQKLVIKNIFDGSVNLADYGGGPIVSAEMLSRQADMQKNANEAQLLTDVRNLDGGSTEITMPADATATAKNEEVRNEEVTTTQKNEESDQQVNAITTDLSEIQKVINSAELDASKSAALAYAEGYKKSNEALTFFKEADKQQKIANTAFGNSKEVATNKAIEAKSRGEQLAKESELSLEYAELFTNKQRDISAQASIVNKSAESIQFLIDNKNFDKASDEFTSLKSKVVIPSSDEAVIQKEKTATNANRIKLQQEIANAENSITSISTQLTALDDEKKSLEKVLSETKNKKEIAKIETRLGSISLDEEDLNFEITKNQQAIADKQLAVENLKFEENFATKLQNSLANSEALISDIPANQRESLKENVDYFTDNNLLYQPKAISGASSGDELSIKNQLASLPKNSYFEERISGVKSVLVAEEKNLQLAEINKDWSNTLSERIRLNEQLISISSNEDKQSINSTIESLSTLKQQKLGESEEYLRLANAVPASEGTSTIAENTPEPAYNEGYRIDLNRSDLIADERSRVESQIAIYEDWNESINSDINVIVGRVSTNGATETTSNQLAALKNQKSENETIIRRLQEKFTLAANSAPTPPERESMPDAVKPELSNTTSTADDKDQIGNGLVSSTAVELPESVSRSGADTKPNTTSNSNENAENLAVASTGIAVNKIPTSKESGISSTNQSNLNTSAGINYTAPVGTEADLFSDLKYASDVTYTSNKSQQLLKSAETEKQEASQLMAQYEEAKKTALLLPSAKERSEALAAADNLRSKSEKKQLKASSLYSDANKYQYVQQNNELNNYPKFSQQFQSKNLDLADLLLNESEYYIAEAQNLRNGINEEERFTEKTVTLQKAYTYEVIALKKQEEAKVALAQATVEYENPSAAKVAPRKVVSATVSDAGQAADGSNVLAAREAILAENLRAEVEAIDAEIALLQSKLKEAKNEEEQKVLEAEIINLTDKRDSKENQASILERRGEQLAKQLGDIEAKREERLEAIFAEKKERNQLRGATKLNQIGVDLGEVDLTEEEYNSIKSNPAFVIYAKQINERNLLIKEANVLYQEMEEARANKNASKAASIDKMIRIKNLLAQRKEEEASKTIANIKSSEALKMRKAGALASGLATGSFEIDEVLLAENTSPNSETDAAGGSTQVDLGSISPTDNKKNTTNNTRSSSGKSTTGVNTANAGTTVKLTATKDGIFSQLSPNESGYSKNNPIPIDVPLPDGIIYKVQVGAFRNPISQDLFKGFAPLMGEKVSTGITRYTAGIFLDFSNADEAKKAIRDLGYSDAFVVAFKDGKRVGVREARDGQTTGEQSPTADEVRAMIRKLSVREDNTSVAESQSGASSKNTNQGLPSEFSEANVAPVKNIEVIDGVYFTVQVGVYSKPITKGEIDVPELAVKVVKSKLYRYSSGVFNDPLEAAKARDKIKQTVPDAFVIAYNNGTKISLEKALELLNQ